MAGELERFDDLAIEILGVIFDDTAHASSFLSHFLAELLVAARAQSNGEDANLITHRLRLFDKGLGIHYSAICKDENTLISIVWRLESLSAKKRSPDLCAAEVRLEPSNTVQGHVHRILVVRDNDLRLVSHLLLVGTEADDREEAASG